MKKSFRESVRFYLSDITTIHGKVIDIALLFLNLLLCVLFVLDTYFPEQEHLFSIIDTVVVSVLIVEFGM